MIAANKKIEALMLAMSEYEGWDPNEPNSKTQGSRSYRNHNPGNLRRSPFAHSIVDNFAVFRNDFVGFMAFHWDLMQKARGHTVTGLNGESTVKDLIYTWAPPSDGNDSEKYLKYIVKKSGLSAETTLAEIFNLE